MSPQRSYQLARFAILRLTGLIYFCAFCVFLKQGLPLLGHDGLTPADQFVRDVVAHFGSRGRAFWELPSVFWAGISDGGLIAVAWIGAALALLAALGLANGISMALLWALYLSIVHVGQIWYGYGWENQLLETGFLGIFLCPLVDPRPFPPRSVPAPMWTLYRWLAFRIMLGAGLIKLRGDPCWRDLTCLDFHYLTQPIPNPLSRAFHLAPPWLHAAEVLGNHVCELVAPFFLFGPRIARRCAGAALIAFQLTLIASGNLSFLNWLTIIPALACFDDGLFARQSVPSSPSRSAAIAGWTLALVVGVLSIPAAANLMSPHQRMNTSHEPFELVNSYGAFGSVGKVRNEIIFEGTEDAALTDATVWKPYEFKCKPGTLDRRPCVVSPYHLRLDWQVWFAAMGSPDDQPWFVHWVWKLLHNDAGALSLIDSNPFPDHPPHYIRARLYRYQFAAPGSGAWWTRTLEGEWLPPVAVDDEGLRAFLDAYQWR